MSGQLQKLVVILGPTASGKSHLAYRIATDVKAEVINADSLQMYKYMNIGTAKPGADILSDIPHHLIDIITPDTDFNAGLFRKEASSIIDSLSKRSKRIVVVGGTYLYVRVLTQGLIEGVQPDTEFRKGLKAQRYIHGTSHIYQILQDIDPESAANINENDYVRIERALEVYHLTAVKMSSYQKEHSFSDRKYDLYKIGIDIDREVLKKIIENRLTQMIDEGFVDEVKDLRSKGYGKNLKPMQSIGYKEINDYLDGLITYDEAVEKAVINTRRLAKRQMTWLRRDKEINWYKVPEDYTQILSDLRNFYST